MKYLKEWWGAILAVIAAIAGGVGLFLMGRRAGISEEAHDAAVDDVEDTAKEGDELVAKAEEDGNAAVEAADNHYEESVNASTGESPVELLNRLAGRR